MIRVLIVDDSSFMRKALRHLLSIDPEIEVVDEAGDGREAIGKILAQKPDVVTMDLIMPGVDGLWALEEVMKQRPTPVVVVSSLGINPSEVASEAFSLGVVDVMTKPDSPAQMAAVQRELIEKIKAASRVNRFRLLEARAARARERTPANTAAISCLIVATSAGGPASLYEVIPRLSKTFLGSVVIAQHMPSPFIDSFVGHIRTMTPMPVKVAEKGDMLYSRRVLFSPTNATLEVRRTKKGCVADIVDHQMRLQPDINSAIISCAESFRSSTVLVVLSGLGTDGVAGAEAVKKYGGKVIVEDETTAGVFSGMPSNVMKSGFYDIACPSYRIAEAVEASLLNKPFTGGTQFMVKGVVLRSALQYLKNRFPRERVAQLTAQLSAPLQDLFANGNIRPYNYYSGELSGELYRTVDKVLGPQHPSLLEELGAENARECIEAYRTVLSLTSVADMPTFLQMLGKVVFPGVTGEILELKPELKQAKFLLRSKGYTDETVKISAKTIRGWVAHLLGYLNQTPIEIATEPGRDDRGYFVKCSFRWR